MYASEADDEHEDRNLYWLSDASLRERIRALDLFLGKPEWYFEHCALAGVGDEEITGDQTMPRRAVAEFAGVIGRSVTVYKEKIVGLPNFDYPVVHTDDGYIPATPMEVAPVPKALPEDPARPAETRPS